MITDLFASTQRFNVPGAVADSNWSERLPGGPKQWARDAKLQARLKRLRPILAKSGRLP
jgi:4-alpha-glucanotransferase